MLRSGTLNRRDFGRPIEVDPTMVSHWASDRNPRPDACRLIADGLALPVAEVLEQVANQTSLPLLCLLDAHRHPPDDRAAFGAGYSKRLISARKRRRK